MLIISVYFKRLFFVFKVLRNDDVPPDSDEDYKVTRDARFRNLIQDLCPLADRFGRVLTDLSPLLRALSASNAPPLSAVAAETSHWGPQNALPGDYFPAPEHPTSNMLEMSLASLLRPRYGTLHCFADFDTAFCSNYYDNDYMFLQRYILTFNLTIKTVKSYLLLLLLLWRF